MFSFAPNVSWLLPELPFAQRLSALASAGFQAIEFGFPSQVDLEALAAARQEWGFEIILFNQDVPVWDRANRGYLVDPARQSEFQRTLDQALEIAGRLKVHKIMLPSGVEVPGLNRGEMRACMLENLRYAAPLALQAGVVLTIEALNPDDNPGYYLTTSQEAIEIVQELDHPNVRFQFDTYHLQKMEGGLDELMRAYQAWIGHIQFADYPGRHEPGTGQIDFNALVAAIQESGYADYIGLEYIPLAPGLEALKWVPQNMRAALRQTL